MPPACSGSRRRTSRGSAARRSCTTSAPPSFRTRSGTSPARSPGSEFDRVELHPMLTEQMLRRSPALAALNPVACAHHEKCDGSGYHRRLQADADDLGACVLAATEIYVGLTTERADRPPFSPEDAAAELRRLESAGVLEPRASRAVLVAAGHGEPRGRDRQAPEQPRRAHPARGRGAAPRGQGAHDPPDRRPALHLAQDRRPPHPAHLRQDRRVDAGRRCALGDAAHGRPVIVS